MKTPQNTTKQNTKNHKPLHLHGSLGRDTATGRGVLYAAREFLRESMFTKV